MVVLLPLLGFSTQMPQVLMKNLGVPQEQIETVINVFRQALPVIPHCHIYVPSGFGEGSVGAPPPLKLNRPAVAGIPFFKLASKIAENILAQIGGV